MGAFQSGFQMGGNIAQDAMRLAQQERELALREAADARAAKEFGWREQTQADQRAAREAYGNMIGGVGPDQAARLQQTYGMNPTQTNQALAGGAAGLRAKLASYDTPDSFDLQNVPDAPAAGMQPRFTADQLKTAAPTRMQREQGLERMALSGLDTTSLRQAQQAQLDLEKNDIASRVMSMKDDELEKMAPQVSKSGYPLLYTGKGKGGYTFLRTESDGITPVSGSQFTLNSSQLRQMALAHELGTAGFGTEALQTLAAAHKDLGDHVKTWNDALTKTATVNNAAVHAGNQDANDATRTGAMSKFYGRPQAANMREFQNSKGESVLVDITGLKPNADGTIPIPTGLKPKSARPEFTPKAYAETVKLYTETGMSLPDAQMQADRDYGRGPAAGGSVDTKLQGLNKAAAQRVTPQIIRQGETTFVDPTRPVRSPVEDFTRESERGLFGLNYFYRDPLTKQRYTVDEYNKLLNQ